MLISCRKASASDGSSLLSTFTATSVPCHRALYTCTRASSGLSQSASHYLKVHQQPKASKQHPEAGQGRIGGFAQTARKDESPTSPKPPLPSRMRFLFLSSSKLRLLLAEDPSLRRLLSEHLRLSGARLERRSRCASTAATASSMATTAATVVATMIILVLSADCGPVLHPNFDRPYKVVCPYKWSMQVIGRSLRGLIAASQSSDSSTSRHALTE